MEYTKFMVLDADTISQQCLPKHVAIIMDGNGRWAQARNRPRVYGHKKGVDAVRQSVQFCTKLGIQSLTLFAFSSENWRRPEDEVNTLMELFLFVLSKEVTRSGAVRGGAANGHPAAQGVAPRGRSARSARAGVVPTRQVASGGTVARARRAVAPRSGVAARARRLLPGDAAVERRRRDLGPAEGGLARS